MQTRIKMTLYDWIAMLYTVAAGAYFGWNVCQWLSARFGFNLSMFYLMLFFLALTANAAKAVARRAEWKQLKLLSLPENSDERYSIF